MKGEGTNSGESKLKCGIHKDVGKRKGCVEGTQ